MSSAAPHGTCHRFWYGQKTAQAKALLEAELNTLEKEALLILQTYILVEQKKQIPEVRALC